MSLISAAGDRLICEYQVLDSGKADVSIIFTTDGQIAQGKELLLQDDKHMFPPYNVTLVFRKSVLDKLGPDATNTIAKVQQALTTPAMQELNSRVDIDKKTPATVAHEPPTRPSGRPRCHWTTGTPG